MGDEFEVKVEDLTNRTKVFVDIECDCCEKIQINVSWAEYKKHVHEDGRYYCQKCVLNGYKKWISFFEWCYINLSKEIADYILLRWDYELNIDKKGNKLTPHDIGFSSHGFKNKGYWFKCLEYPEHGSELKNINGLTSNGRQRFINCSKCNKIYTANPELINYLVNPEDAYRYSAGSSSKKIPMQCLDCGYEKYLTPNSLTNNGFSCPRCGDGVSYPEKFFLNFLEQVKVKFEPQLSKIIFAWCKDYKYDFYIDELNGIICECHGLQHYEDAKHFKLSLEEVQENDKNKEELAKENGTEEDHYIILDCRYSDMKWIKDSIMQSKLPQFLNFKESDIDWIKCHEMGISNLVKICCKMWSSGIRNTLEIAGILKLSRGTICRYLKQGTKLNWCDYDGAREHALNLFTLHEKMGVKVICLTTGEIFDSQKEAGENKSISPSSIYSCCKGKSKSAGKHPITKEKLVWQYYSEYIKNQELQTPISEESPTKDDSFYISTI